MRNMSPPVGPKSRHLLPGSDFASLTTGKNDPNRAGAHLGLDFQPEKPGQADPIYWPEDATILRIVRNRVKGSKLASLYSGHTGNAVEFKGSGGRVWHFRHMPQWALKNLKVGQKVKRGNLATYMGTTGNSNGVHLHIGVRINGRFVDPAKVLRDHNAWPIGNDWHQPKPKPVDIKPAAPAPAPEPPKEWSDMASEAEIAAVFDRQFKKFFSEDEVIPWTDYETGEKKTLTRDDAIRYGVAPKTTEKVMVNVLTNIPLVDWVDSNTEEDKSFPITKSLTYGQSLQWNREIERDAARDAEPTQTDAPKDAEPVQPSAPTN